MLRYLFSRTSGLLLEDHISNTAITALIHTTTEEAAAWAELAEFRKDVLSKAWVLSEKEQSRAKRKAEGWNRNRERKAREEHKRKKERLKEKTNCSTKEKAKQDGNGQHETIKRQGNGNEIRADRAQRRRPDREPVMGTSHSMVARAKVTRPAVSGNFDALGL